MNPIMFEFAGISIRWYSFFILIGIILGFLLAIIEGKKKDIDPGTIFDMGFYLVVFGIIGARIYYCLFNFDMYKNNLISLIKIWNGGLAIHGGIIAGLITIIIFSKSEKIKTLKLTDIVAPSLILAQAIGRWGNFFNSEAHGPATSFAFLRSLKIIPNFVIKGMKIDGVFYHPTFYYESLWCLLGFLIIILLRLIIKNRKDGEITFIYLTWYSIGRYFIESLRTDSLMIGDYKMAQLISLVIGIISLISLIIIKLYIPKDERIKKEKTKTKKVKKDKKTNKPKEKEENNIKEIKEEKKETKKETKKDENSK